MPSKIKTSITGDEIVKFFESFGFVLNRMNGGHMIMKRSINNQKKILLIPRHKVVLKGTLKAIVNQSALYIPIDDLNDFFYTK